VNSSCEKVKEGKYLYGQAIQNFVEKTSESAGFAIDREQSLGGIQRF
jgi:hypothetical protein